MLKIVFVSNYYNHHQSSFSQALSHRKDTEYYFIETMPMEAERKNMGWQAGGKPPYVLSAYESDDLRAKCAQLIQEADFVMVASDASLDPYMAQRHRAKGIIFRNSERFYKNGCPKWQLPLRFVKNYWRFGRFQNEYLLCSSAFTAADAALTRSFLGKTYRWGYFPATKHYDLPQLLAQKGSEPVSLLWAGRFLDWKHPDDAVRTAEYLRDRGIPFTLRIIGTGDMENALARMIREKRLSDHVEMLGSMSPQQVRAHMERAHIYLFTSDYQEGWGAVLNEAMNSGCAVVANCGIGSVPFLVRDGENGFLYRNGDLPGLFQAVERLALDRSLREKTGAAAYETIIHEWNAETAAQRLVALYEDLRDKGSSTLFSEGPCSPAPILPNEWYRHD